MNKKQFCIHGHDTSICGRDAQNACRQCIRDKSKRKHDRYRKEQPEVLKIIAKRAYEKNKVYYINAAKEWAVNNPDKVRFTARKSRLKRFYRLTLDQYNDLLAKQDNKCAICTNSFLDLMFDPFVDHDHNCCPINKSCGKCVRGLLCLTCNSALGYLKENISSFERAISYLKINSKNNKS